MDQMEQIRNATSRGRLNHAQRHRRVQGRCDMGHVCYQQKQQRITSCNRVEVGWFWALGGGLVLGPQVSQLECYSRLSLGREAPRMGKRSAQ